MNKANDLVTNPISPTQNAVKPSGARKRALGAVAAVVVLSGLVWGVYEWRVLSKVETTDNAYVQGHVVQVTPLINGTVQAVLADDTDFVKAGQTLVRLDGADALVALDAAKAQLAQAVRQVQALYANDQTFGAQVAVREAEWVRAQTEVARTQESYQRRQPLAGQGVVSGEDVAQSRSAFSGAQNALEVVRAGVVAAREQLSASQRLTQGVGPYQHPTVQLAAAKVREAYMNLQRTHLKSPLDGHVARRTVQLGQRVAPGAPLISVIALQDVWVEANFKEVQLRHIRIGQPVTLASDLYGRQVQYRGRVTGLGVGTGAAFALLPAQNATGNWIKVIQRVPVRVSLDREQVAAHPLRVGLSMTASVDVQDTSGKALADTPVAAASGTPEQDADPEVEKLIRGVIAAHMVRPGSKKALR